MKIVDTGSRFGFGVSEIFDNRGYNIVFPRTLQDIERELVDANLVTFGGGEDVCPTLYHQTNLYSFPRGGLPTARDNYEQAVFWMAQKMKVPVLGICRGSQFVCVMSGGHLIQDIGNHGRTHNITVKDKDGPFEMTSTHHQMMFPFTTKHELLGWVKQMSPHYRYDEEVKLNLGALEGREIEIVYFPETNALGIQGHPEYFGDSDHPTVKMVNELIETKLWRKDDHV